MERINIAQVDIDVDALIGKSAEVRRKLMEIGDQMKDLRGDFANGNISVEEYTRRVSELTAIQKVNRDELRVYDTLVKNHISTESKKMQQNEIMKGSIKELSAALSQNKLIYQQLSEEEREKESVGGRLLEVIQQQDKKYKELQKSIGNNQVEVGNYKQAILEALGTNNELGGTLGNLINTFNGLKDKLALVQTPFVNFVQTGKIAPTMLTSTAGATSKASTAMKVFRGALLGTGIGLIVVALGSLIAYLTSTQEGVDKVSRVLTPLKVAMQTLWGVVQQVGKSMLEAFKAMWEPVKRVGDAVVTYLITPIKQAIALGQGLIKVFKGDFEGAWEDVKKPISDVVDKTKEAYAATIQSGKELAAVGKKLRETMGEAGAMMDEAMKRGARIAEIGIQLASSEADYIEKSETLKQLFAEQNQIARDTSKTVEERERAAKASVETLKEINALARERNQLEVERIELQQQSNDTSDEERAELARKKAELNNANKEMINAETAQNKVINSIRNEARREQEAKAKEATERARARMQEEIRWQKEAIEDYVRTNSAVAKSLKERLDIEEKGKDDRLTVLETEKTKGLIKQREYEKQKKEIERDFLKIKAELSIEAVKKEAEQFELQNKTKIDSETRLTAELIAQEQYRQEAIYQKKVEALEKEKQLKQEAHDWDYNAEDAYQQQLLELREGYEAQEIELRKQRTEAEREESRTTQELDFQDKLLTLQERGAMQWEVEAEQMRQNHEMEHEALNELLDSNQISQDEYNRRLNLMNRKHAQDEITLKKKTEEAKLGLAAGALSHAKALFGEHTAVGKAAAIAEAMINTYLGVTKALSAYPPPYNTIMAGVTSALGMANVSKIMDTDVKYAEGGLISGKSHAEGGVPFSVAGRGGFEAEGGEYIVNKRATAMYFPVLEAINSSVRNGSYNPVYMAAGGMVRQMPETKIDYKELMNAIREGSQAGAYEGSMRGALQGTQQGAYEGAKAGSLEGSMQGAYEGATLGTNTGLTESALRISDNELARKTASI
nr:chromosome segregation ATPase [uncultured Capnocytophaga sp.]